MSQQQVMVVLGANIANFQSAMGQVQHTMQQTASQVQSAMNGAESSASSGAGGIKSALGGIAGVVAGAFAVDKIIDFGKTMLDTTADLQAQQGQYDQVMGGMKGSTDKYLGEMAKQWGKHPNELKKSYMQYVAILKSKGMSEADAHATAKKYLSATVDANAFANEDMESTTARFMGGIKGEYDSLDTAMVNLSATMLNDLSMEKYGKKFDDLTVAQQETLKTQEMLRQHTSAGVVGQGEREAGSYQNTLANLKNTYAELLAKFGSPVLEWVNDKLKGLTSTVKGINIKAVQDGFSKFGSYVSSVFTPIIDGVKSNWEEFQGFLNNTTIDNTIWDGLKTALTGVKDVLPKIAEGIGTFIDKFDFLIAGVAGGLIAFKLITGAIKLWSAVTKIASAVQLAFNAVMAMNPIGIVCIAIGALIAIGILLYKNWDVIKEKMGQAWSWIKDKAVAVFNGIKDFFKKWGLTILAVITGPIGILALLIYKNWDAIKAKTSALWNGIKSFLSNLWSGIKSKATAVFNGIKTFLAGVWDGIKSKATGAWNGIKSSISTVVGGIKSKVSDVFSGIKTTATNTWNSIKSAMTKPIESAKSTISGIIDKIKGFFSGLKLKFPSISMPKLPHFTLTGKFGLKPPSVPKLGLSWHANGGIIKGTNAGTVVGIGENGGDEAILPLSNKSRMKPFAHAVANMMPQQQQGNNGGFGDIYLNVELPLDGETIVKKTIKITQEELAKQQQRQNRLTGQYR